MLFQACHFPLNSSKFDWIAPTGSIPRRIWPSRPTRAGYASIAKGGLLHDIHAVLLPKKKSAEKGAEKNRVQPGTVRGRLSTLPSV